MKFAHKLTLALLVVLAVVLSLCNTVLIGQQFRQELHTAQETLSADWQRESRAMQRTLVTPGSGSLAARVGSYLQAITEQNSLACCRLQCGWNLPVLCPAHRGSLIRSGSPACPGWRAAHGAGEQPYPAVRRNGRSAGALHHLGHCAGCRPRVAGAAGPHPKCTDRRTFGHGAWPGAWFCCSAAA